MMAPVMPLMPQRAAHLAALAVVALLLAGCGISLGGGASSELFSKLTIQGEPVVGGEMTLEVTHEQRYPVAVDISCFLVDPGRSRRLLGRDTLPADPDTSPEPTPVAGASTFRFRVQRPGRYLALCNTPLDQDNFISKEFRVQK
jgi:cAMP phosphodiesterase